VKLTVLITPEALGAGRLQAALEAKRDALSKQGVMVPQGPFKRNHTRLFMAATDPGRLDWLRLSRGFARPAAQALLQNTVQRELVAEAERLRPEHMVLSCAQLGSGLATATEVARLKDMLSRVSDDIRIVMHVEDQARALIRTHVDQVFFGRHAGFDQELALAGAADWWTAALATGGPLVPRLNRFPEFHGAPHWIDYRALLALWQGGFGADAVRLRPHDDALFRSDLVTREIEVSLGLDGRIGKVTAAAPAQAPGDAWLERARQLNVLFEKLLGTGREVPRQLWRHLLLEVFTPGPEVDPGALSPISRRFAADNAALVARFPDLGAALAAPPPAPDWTPPNPRMGFRATQYMAVFLPRIDKASADAKKAAALQGARALATEAPQELSVAADRLLPPLARAIHQELAGGRFAPHNRLGTVNEQEPAAPYPDRPQPAPPEGSSGTVIVGCMKNEGPYIVEWIAYHRAIGVHDFLIYTNGCEDGTDLILERLQAMGMAQHRPNDDWKGNSPQQAALDKSLKEPVIRDAEWIIHIDVDEFMNIRAGDGTLEALFAAAPDATAFAMTWRLFGHGGVTAFEDRPVIAQFTRCAPSYCPKPHTAWGFKTMFRNDGSYAKFSCHRPNKLDPGRRDSVKWVNGSGQPMADALKDRGWRNGIADIGYDLIQLNHYALRSADSFLVKRQRGRALHVDRSIGLNYWIRMDWSDATDITIQRNLPRLRAGMDRLLADPELRRLHDAAVAWHRAKAAELHDTPEFQELYTQALATRLNGMERVAYSLALDLES
jgi:hypothetical protein